jgi:hypothetical protein
MLYSHNNQWPTQLPFRIYMPDGTTRTDPTTFTAEDLLLAGYKQVPDSPDLEQNQRLGWDSVAGEWVITTKSEEELLIEEQQALERQWVYVRAQRDEMLARVDWRFIRYESQVRLEITPTDDIHALDTYAQALRDITLQEDPFNIVWPSYEPSA